MLVKTLVVGFVQTNCYVVTDEKTLDAVVIDPGAESGVILDYLEANRLRCRGILLTHAHFDHCMALAAVHEATGAPVYMNERDINIDLGGMMDFVLEPPDDTNTVDDGDVFECGSLTFTAVACPGHTPGGLAYICEDCLFSGDTLFKLTCGRYDFPASSSLDLSRSLEKLRDLPGDYEVYPGHEDCSTLEFERRFNPYMLDPWRI